MLKCHLMVVLAGMWIAPSLLATAGCAEDSAAVIDPDADWNLHEHEAPPPVEAVLPVVPERDDLVLHYRSVEGDYEVELTTTREGYYVAVEIGDGTDAQGTGYWNADEFAHIQSLINEAMGGELSSSWTVPGERSVPMSLHVFADGQGTIVREVRPYSTDRGFETLVTYSNASPAAAELDEFVEAYLDEVFRRWRE